MCRSLEPLRCARLRTSSRGRRHPWGWFIHPQAASPEPRPAVRGLARGTGRAAARGEACPPPPACARARLAEGLRAGETEGIGASDADQRGSHQFPTHRLQPSTEDVCWRCDLPPLLSPGSW